MRTHSQKPLALSQNERLLGLCGSNWYQRFVYKTPTALSQVCFLFQHFLLDSFSPMICSQCSEMRTDTTLDSNQLDAKRLQVVATESSVYVNRLRHVYLLRPGEVGGYMPYD